MTFEVKCSHSFFIVWAFSLSSLDSGWKPWVLNIVNSAWIKQEDNNPGNAAKNSMEFKS